MGNPRPYRGARTAPLDSKRKLGLYPQ